MADEPDVYKTSGTIKERTQTSIEMGTG